MIKVKLDTVPPSLYRAQENVVRLVELISKEAKLSNDETNHQLLESMDCFNQFIENIQRAIELLDEAHLLSHFSQAQIKQLQNLDLSTITPNNEPLYLKLELSNDRLLQFYQLAKSFFSKEKYSKSNSIFFFLSILNSNVAAFWYGWGRCLLKLDKHQEAISCFTMATTLEIDCFKYFYALCKSMLEAHFDHPAKELITFGLSHYKKPSEIDALRRLEKQI